jgi:co-chaperonin GroES (HSP10)
MKAVGVHILVKPIEEEMKSSSGLMMSANDKGRERYKKAKVISVGDDIPFVKDGDLIYYDKSGGREILIDQNLFVVISGRDIVVVLPPHSSS